MLKRDTQKRTFLFKVLGIFCSKKGGGGGETLVLTSGGGGGGGGVGGGGGGGGGGEERGGEGGERGGGGQGKGGRRKGQFMAVLSPFPPPLFSAKPEALTVAISPLLRAEGGGEDAASCPPPPFFSWRKCFCCPGIKDEAEQGESKGEERVSFVRLIKAEADKD